MRELVESERTAQEILNGLKGGEPGTEKTYSSDPDYSEVDPELFEYLDEYSLEE